MRLEIDMDSIFVFNQRGKGHWTIELTGRCGTVIHAVGNHNRYIDVQILAP